MEALRNRQHQLTPGSCRQPW